MSYLLNYIVNVLTKWYYILFLLYFVNVMPNIDTQHFIIILLYIYVILLFYLSMSFCIKQKHEISCIEWVMEYVVKLRYSVCITVCFISDCLNLHFSMLVWWSDGTCQIL